MKIKFLSIFYLITAIFISAAAAEQALSVESFSKSFSDSKNEAPVPALSGADFVKSSSAETEIAARLDKWMSVFNDLELQPATDLSVMSQTILRGLQDGTYNGVILGESHGSEPETEAGIRITKDILETRGIGAFSRESNIFPVIDFLEERKVPVLTFKNQFNPEPDVKAGLKAAGKNNILVTYTGHAHTAIRLKNYILYTLEAGKFMGYGQGGKDMPTVEDAFLKAGKKPVIVAMVTEDTVFRKVERLFLTNLAGKDGIYSRELLNDLQTVGKLWSVKVSRYPVRPEKIYFAQFPGQTNFFVGITPGNRKPVAIDAVSRVLPLPELDAWLGTEKIKVVESLYMSDPSGISYKVVIHKFNGETFERVVRP